MREESLNNKKCCIETVFAEMYTPLVRYANRYLKDTEVCEDIVQELFVKLWYNEADLKGIRVLNTYLYHSIRNKCLNYLKNKQSREKVAEVYASFQTTVEHGAYEESVYSQLMKCIDELPPQACHIMRMALSDASNADIADELNISINSVKTHKRISYNYLRTKMSEAYFLNSSIQFDTVSIQSNLVCM